MATQMRDPATGAILQPAHLVHFYDGEDDRTRTVSSYLAEGLQAGRPALSISTPEHTLAVMAQLGAAGIDVARARRAGKLLTLDAAEVLSGFMVDGVADLAAFDTLVGSIVRETAAHGPIRAYGEMVALLWDEGNVTGALDLERLWNSLLGTVSLDLLCTYPATLVEGGGEQLADLCGLHSSAGGAVVARSKTGRRDKTSFPIALDSPRVARRFVSDALRRWGMTALLDDAAIVVTELATNAVTHARTAFTVEVTSDASGLRIAVRDRSATMPLRGVQDPLAGGGHGLSVVATLAASWGADRTSDGKVVWARWDRTSDDQTGGGR